MSDALVSQPRTASQINISDSVALLDKIDDSIVGQELAVAEMYVVQILTQKTYSSNGLIGDVTTFGQNEVPHSWCGRDEFC